MTRRPLFSSAPQAVLVLLFLAAIPLAGLSAARKIATFGTADVLFTVEDRALRVRVVGDSASPTGLSAGDLVFSIGGREAASVEDPGSLLAHEPLEITALRNGQMVRLTTRPSPAPWSTRYLFLLAVGTVFFAAGFTAVRPGVTATSEGLVFAGFSLAVSLVLVLTPVPPLDGLFRASVVVEDLARALFPSLLLHLSFTFPRRARWIAPVLFHVPALLLAGLSLAPYAFPGRPPADATVEIARLDRIQAIWMTCGAIAAAARLFVLSRRATDLLAEKQVRFLLLGTGAGILPPCLLDLLPRIFGGPIPIVSSLALLPLALVPLAFLAAITRYRLWDVEVLGRETTALLGAVFLSAGFFTLVQLTAPGPGSIPYAKGSLQVAAGLLLAVSFIPVQRGFSRSLSRLQYRESFRDREGLLSLVKELTVPRRLGEIETLLVSRVASGLLVRPAALLFASGGRLDARHVDGGHPLDVAELPDELGEEPVRLTRRTADDRPTTAVLRLRRAGFRTLAPLTVSGRLHAVLAFGDREGRTPPSREDLSLLSTVLAQAALALDHARLYEEVREQADRYRLLKEFHENVVAGSAAAIAATDEDGRFVSANAAFERLTGKTFTELSALRETQVLPATILMGGPAHRLEVDLGSGPRVLDVAVSAFPGTSAGSRAKVFVVHDATETARLERALVDRERLAALGSLSAGVAHEVNTPLAGVAGFARLLLDEIPSEDPRHELVEKIERQAFRASRLVSSLLDLARGRPRDLAPQDAAHLAREAARALEDDFAAREARLELTLSAEPLPFVAGHADALIQVLVNLLKNGLEASSNGPSPCVRLNLREASHHVQIDVIDNGPGLHPEALARIFEPFYSTKIAQGGTGLGLAIARDIIRAHGGTLEARNEPEGGARFTLRLPVPGRGEVSDGDSVTPGVHEPARDNPAREESAALVVAGRSPGGPAWRS